MPLKTKQNIPPLFLERLKDILPGEHYDNAVKWFSSPTPTSIRINTLKTVKKDVLEKLRENGIGFKEILWAEEALILTGIEASVLGEMDIVTRGEVYRQGLSSMLPVVALDPRPGENVLDMCAAPGSKTTQMAARMNNRGTIVAIDAVRGRYYRLRAVAQLLGAENIVFHLMDARRFRAKSGLFDKILVDAPCSSEGRFKTDDPKTFAYWSLRKIKEMVKKQRGLLLSASRLLKPGGTLVYSTCTFAPEENEGAVDWLLRKTDHLGVDEFRPEGVVSYRAVMSLREKEFDPRVERCLRVLPTEETEGFFLARFKRNQ